MTNGAPPTRDPLDDKVNRLFAGKVVRKDLVRKVKVGANVPVFVLEFVHWSRATQEQALAEAGFRNIAWVRPQCSPDGEAKYGREYWSDYLTNPHAVPITCEK